MCVRLVHRLHSLSAGPVLAAQKPGAQSGILRSHHPACFCSEGVRVGEQ